MRFPHLAGFQQCQLFDTFFRNSTMNEIQTKAISYWNKVAAAVGVVVVAASEQRQQWGWKGRGSRILGDLTSPESDGLESKHNKERWRWDGEGKRETGAGGAGSHCVSGLCNYLEVPARPLPWWWHGNVKVSDMSDICQSGERATESERERSGRRGSDECLVRVKILAIVSSQTCLSLKKNKKQS